MLIDRSERNEWTDELTVVVFTRQIPRFFHIDDQTDAVRLNEISPVDRFDLSESVFTCTFVAWTYRLSCSSGSTLNNCSNGETIKIFPSRNILLWRHAQQVDLFWVFDPRHSMANTPHVTYTHTDVSTRTNQIDRSLRSNFEAKAKRNTNRFENDEISFRQRNFIFKNELRNENRRTNMWIVFD